MSAKSKDEEYDDLIHQAALLTEQVNEQSKTLVSELQRLRELMAQIEEGE